MVQISAYVDTLLATLLPTGRRGGAGLRAGHVHAAGEPVRHVGVGRRAARDVGRARHRGGGRARYLRRTPRRPGSARSPSSSCPSAVAFLALGHVVAARCTRPDEFSRRRRFTCGASLPARPSACWRRPWGGSTRLRSTRSRTRGRRCASRSSGCRHRCLRLVRALPFRAFSSSAGVGGRRAHRLGRRWPDGWSSLLLRHRLRWRIGWADRPGPAAVARLWGAAGRVPAALGRLQLAQHRGAPPSCAARGRCVLRGGLFGVAYRWHSRPGSWPSAEGAQP